ncbi:MAG: hypothetical protein HC933_03395 [Pleurocapsa sp. SU_196_0]|nr:hypothetical protein [Pleurocapsa sp. SU_196_0]
MRRLAGTPFELVFTKTAAKEFDRLAIRDAVAMRTALELLARTGDGDIKVLEGAPDIFRLRVRQTRAEFTVVHRARSLTVIRVFYRQEGYKTKGRSRR